MLNLSRDFFKQITLKDLSRQISKTTSVTNSDALISKNNEKQQTKNDEKTTTNLPHNIRKNRRLLSTLQSTATPLVCPPIARKEERREFMSVFPDIVRDLTTVEEYQDLPEVNKWFRKVLQYNIPNGKKARGLSVIVSYKLLARPDELTPENIRLANIIGWCCELLQGYFLVFDDIMDEAKTRRGQPAWHQVPDVGLKALNDGLLINSSIFQLLKKHCRHKPYYIQMVELFQDISLKTELGQCMDLLSIKNGKPRLELFTMEHYETIVKYKTGFYSFNLPVACALLMAGVNDPEVYRQARTIMLEMGHLFQVQDDFIDCFGNADVTGKIGTDIQDGKCTWLAVVALQRATVQQRAIMEQHYGSKNKDDVDKIVDLYEKLNLPNIYYNYEEESYNLIRTHIQQISKGLPHELFFSYLDKLYRRDR